MIMVRNLVRYVRPRKGQGVCAFVFLTHRHRILMTLFSGGYKQEGFQSATTVGEQTKQCSTRDSLHFDQIYNCMEGNGSQVSALR